MNSQTQVLQRIGIAILAIMAVLGLVRTLRDNSANKVEPDREKKVGFKIEVLAQEEGFPGKVIRISSEGRLTSYTCAPDDAAIAVFTMRDNRTHEPLSPALYAAKDPEGRGYAVEFHAIGGVNLLTIHGGFAKRPSAISVTVMAGNRGRDESTAKLVISHIASPHRVLAAPTEQEASEADKAVRVEIDDVHNPLKVIPFQGDPGHEQVVASVLGTSHSTTSPLANPGFDPFAFDTYFSHGVDAVKVRLDRNRLSDSEVTFTYKGASVVLWRGQHVLLLPTTQVVGTFGGFEASIGAVKRDLKPGPAGRSSISHAELVVLLAQLLSDGTKQVARPPLPQLKYLDISPSLASMGLDSLDLEVGPSRQPGTVPSFYQTLKAVGKISKSGMAIPELKIRFTLSIPHPVGSQELVAPIHHAL